MAYRAILPHRLRDRSLTHLRQNKILHKDSKITLWTIRKYATYEKDMIKKYILYYKKKMPSSNRDTGLKQYEKIHNNA